jgi:hypothetical protein
MPNNTFCRGVCATLMGDPGFIFLQEVFIGITRHRTVEFPVAVAHGITVPAFNGSSPPL